MFRSILAVVAGYVTLIIGVSAFFAIVTWSRPELLDDAAVAPTWLYWAEAGVALPVAVLGGYVAGWVAPSRPVLHGAILAGLVAVLGVANLAAEWGLKPVASSLFLALVPPLMAVLGARLRERVVGRGAT